MTNEPDAHFSADCRSRVIFDQISDKWSMMILVVLNEPRRFNVIKRRLGGITQRVLTQTLRRLERNGIVVRRVLVGRVLGVEYALTPLGQALEAPLTALYLWTVENMDTIAGAQEDYDRAIEADSPGPTVRSASDDN